MCPLGGDQGELQKSLRKILCKHVRNAFQDDSCKQKAVDTPGRNVTHLLKPKQTIQIPVVHKRSSPFVVDSDVRVQVSFVTFFNFDACSVGAGVSLW